MLESTYVPQAALLLLHASIIHTEKSYNLVINLAKLIQYGV